MINDRRYEEKIKKFYETDEWQTAYELQKEVLKLTRFFPSEEKYGLTNQLNKSANSVAANIAEAYGRYYADKVRVLYTVRGEIEETQSHLIVAQSRGCADKRIVIDLVNSYESLKKKINGNIGDFSRKKQNK